MQPCWFSWSSLVLWGALINSLLVTSGFWLKSRGCTTSSCGCFCFHGSHSLEKGNGSFRNSNYLFPRSILRHYLPLKKGLIATRLVAIDPSRGCGQSLPALPACTPGPDEEEGRVMASPLFRPPPLNLCSGLDLVPKEPPGTLEFLFRLDWLSCCLLPPGAGTWEESGVTGDAPRTPACPGQRLRNQPCPHRCWRNGGFAFKERKLYQN